MSERTAVLIAGLSAAAILAGMLAWIELDLLLQRLRVTRRRRARAGYLRERKERQWQL